MIARPIRQPSLFRASSKSSFLQLLPGEPEKAQILVEGAEELYREIGVENTLQDGTGNPVTLKEGAEVEVTIEAEPEATTPKKQPEAKESARPTLEKNKKAAS